MILQTLTIQELINLILKIFLKMQNLIIAIKTDIFKNIRGKKKSDKAVSSPQSATRKRKRKLKGIN